VRISLVRGIERIFRSDSEGILSFGRSQSLGILEIADFRFWAAMSDHEEDIGFDMK
jgi:hypothetical protein